MSIIRKYLILQPAFESKTEYYKTIGFREDEGKIEDVEDYVKRVEAYMKLYGALVQVCTVISILSKSSLFSQAKEITYTVLVDRNCWNSKPAWLEGRLGMHYKILKCSSG